LFCWTAEALSGWFESHGLPAYRARQVMEWVYGHGAVSFEQMTNLPAGLRAELAGEFAIYRSTVAADSEAPDGTRKLLLCWPDGATSECVLIPEPERNTACISSQVGCPVQCTFCASGIGGLERQLTAGEIIEQAMRVQALCAAPATGLHRAFRAGGAAPQRCVPAPEPDARTPKPKFRALTNIVFMGIGEPLANYEAVVAAVRTINAPWGMNIGARRITISTVGLPRQIRRLADEGLQINLAISLHAASDDLRRRLIPWAERVSISELVDAARYYFERTGREVTLEYVMRGGVNVRSADAQRLARVTRQMRCNVNLIPYNPVAGRSYRRPDDGTVQEFVRALRERGVNAHVRRSRGLEIDAACGQLREAHKTQAER